MVSHNTDKTPEFVNIVLAEFSCLKSEIATRSKAQESILVLNITAIGAIGGLFLSHSEMDPRILFLIPIISSLLGMVYVDHAINIGNIGRFIQQEVKPQLSQAVASRLVDYETYVRQFEERGCLRFFLLGMPGFFMFGGAPLTAIILPFFVIQPQNYNVTFWVSAILGGMLIVMFICFWIQLETGHIWGECLSKPRHPLRHEPVE